MILLNNKLGRAECSRIHSDSCIHWLQGTLCLYIKIILSSDFSLDLDSKKPYILFIFTHVKKKLVYFTRYKYLTTMPRRRRGSGFNAKSDSERKRESRKRESSEQRQERLRKAKDHIKDIRYWIFLDFSYLIKNIIHISTKSHCIIKIAIQI